MVDIRRLKVNKKLELDMQNSVHRYSYTIPVARPYDSDPDLTTEKRAKV
jgi:hypothetical protein